MAEYSRVSMMLDSLFTGRGFWVFFSSFIAVLFVVRLVALDGASADDAEQLFFAQSWAWGYKGNQPPLYTWLVMLAQSVFGVGLFSVLLVKFSALFALGATMFLAASKLLDIRLSVLAALSLFGFYYIGWDALLNYSHTVLLAAMVAFSLYLFIRLKAGGRIFDYALFGLFIGLGLLTKYNYGVFLVALCVASLATPALRSVLMSRSMLVTIAVVVIVITPHGLWVLESPSSFLNATQGLPGEGAKSNQVIQALKGFLDLAQGMIAFVMPALLLAGLCFPRVLLPYRLLASDRTHWFRFFEVFGLAFVGLIVVALLVSGVPEVRNHWLMPLIIMVVYFFVRLQALGASARALRRYLALLLVIFLILPLALVGRAWHLREDCHKCGLTFPHDQLAQALIDGGFKGGTIVDYGWPIQYGANLRPYFPTSRIASVRFGAYRAPDHLRSSDKGQCLVLWRGDHRLSALRGQNVLDLARQHFGVTTRATDGFRVINIPMPAKKPDGVVPLHALVIPRSQQGQCN